MPEITKTLYVKDAAEWRAWLTKHYQTEPEIWLILPHKASGKPKIVYNDSVEEALCFGWIDSIVKKYDNESSVQRFTPRNMKVPYSRQNKERLKLLAQEGKLLPEILEQVQDVLNEEYVFPKDIITAIKKNSEAWQNFQNFSEAYKRIRVDYIDEGRRSDEEFKRRLDNFIKKTEQNKQIGFGGIDKYF